LPSLNKAKFGRCKNSAGSILAAEFIQIAGNRYKQVALRDDRKG
jgi:hypothetical protein